MHRFLRKDAERLLRASQVHRQTLQIVRRALRKRGLRFRSVYRTGGCSYAPYDLIISVGGDGTFLEAARPVWNQWVLGVNSDPTRSTGSFCKATAETFERVLNRILAGRGKVEKLHRLRVQLNGKEMRVPVLNDVLVTHRRPAVMSRYWVEIRGVQEQQRSSGLWIATASGSTGAIRSAGGCGMPRCSRAIQYRPRELYLRGNVSCRWRGGILSPGQVIRIGSLMQDALVCIDGDHVTFPFRYGNLLEVKSFPEPLRLIS